MAMARLAVALPCNAADNGEATFWLGVIAFGKQAYALAKHRKGDLVSVTGNMQLNQWAGQDETILDDYQAILGNVFNTITGASGINELNRRAGEIY